MPRSLSQDQYRGCDHRKSPSAVLIPCRSNAGMDRDWFARFHLGVLLLNCEPDHADEPFMAKHHCDLHFRKVVDISSTSNLRVSSLSLDSGHGFQSDLSSENFVSPSSSLSRPPEHVLDLSQLRELHLQPLTLHDSANGQD